jgi:hypothetical protein
MKINSLMGFLKSTQIKTFEIWTIDMIFLIILRN